MLLYSQVRHVWQKCSTLQIFTSLGHTGQLLVWLAEWWHTLARNWSQTTPPVLFKPRWISAQKLSLFLCVHQARWIPCRDCHCYLHAHHIKLLPKPSGVETIWDVPTMLFISLRWVGGFSMWFWWMPTFYSTLSSHTWSSIDGIQRYKMGNKVGSGRQVEHGSSK